MPNENDVFQGAAGTGLAWMGPNSTFDPTKFAIDAFNAKVKKKTEEETLQEETGKILDFKPGEQFNIDLNTITTRGIQNLQNYGKELFQKDKGVTYQNQQEITNAARDLKLQQQELETQYKDWQNVRKIVDADKGKELSFDKMNRNLAFYENPEEFVETTMFSPYKGGYEEIVTNLKKNPRYANDPDALKDAARVQFRNRYHNDLLGTVLKPESVFKIVKDNEDALYNTLTKDVEKGGVTIKEISNDRGQRKVTFSDGSEKLVDGTDKTATDLYNGSVDYQRSIKELYSDLPTQDKTKYQGAQDPALEWFKDVVNSTAGDVTTSRRVEKSNFTNFGGGYGANSNYQVTPFQKDQLTGRGGAFGNTMTQGFNIRTPNGSSELVLKDINPPYFYLGDKATQNAIVGGKNMTLTGATPFKAPTFGEDVSWDSFKNTLSNVKTSDGNGWQLFLKKFGNKYKDAEKNGTLKGVILTNDEANFLRDIGLGKLIKNGKFAYGTLEYYTEKEDGEGDQKRYHPGAIVPLEYVNSSLRDETNVDFNLALDAQYPDQDYELIKGKVSQSNNSTTSTTQTTPEETGWGEAWSAPKKTPFGKEFDKEDEKGYYFNGRLIEEKGR